MSKKGIYRISGNTSPVVGKEMIYTIEEWYPDTPLLERNPMNVTWELFIKRKSGQFVSTSIRKKESVILRLVKKRGGIRTGLKRI